MTSRTEAPILQDDLPSSDAASALAADLAQLRDLLAQPDLREARAFVKALEARWPDSERVKQFVRVLVPPIVRSVPRGALRPQPRDREIAWLRKHAGEYPGCWLAVLGDELIAADPDLHVVLTQVRAAPGAEQALLHFQPVPQDSP